MGGERRQGSQPDESWRSWWVVPTTATLAIVVGLGLLLARSRRPQLTLVQREATLLQIQDWLRQGAQTQATTRSMPMPKPEWGTEP